MKKTISHLLAILLGLILISATCSPEATTVYSISASPLTPTFASMTVGYTTPPSAQTVTITNNGMDAITLDPLPSVPNYTLSTLSTTLLATNGAKATFTIRPSGGLLMGTYNPTFVVKGSNGSNSVSVTIRPTFTVTASSAFFSGNGTSSSPYLINNAADLNKLSELINLGNMTYAAATVYYRLNSSFIMPPGNFTPIGGTWANPFRGTFNGNNKIITDLTVNTSSDFAGLFGYVDGGKISNLGLVNVNIIGSGNCVGGVAGALGRTDASIAGCYVTGKVSGSWSVGGITGLVEFFNATVINCYTTCAVNGIGEVGGIAGSEYEADNIITRCYATGAISGENYVGGIVGWSNGKVSNNVALNPSIIQTGGAGTYFGRVAGYLDSTSDLTGNAAYKGMNVKGSTVSGGTTYNKDGDDAGLNVINKEFNWKAAGFVSPTWTVHDDTLPGLFGATVEIPSHITEI